MASRNHGICDKCSTKKPKKWFKLEDKKQICEKCFLATASTCKEEAFNTEESNIDIQSKYDQIKLSSRRSKCYACNKPWGYPWRKTDDKKSICNNCYIARANNKNSEYASICQEVNFINSCVCQKIETNYRKAKKKVSSNKCSILKDTEIELEGTVKTEHSNVNDAHNYEEVRATNSENKLTLAKNTTKAKSRRNIFKKYCFKSPRPVSTPTTTNALFSNGTYFQVGDVVDCIDKRNKTYYAQIIGLVQDQYARKSAKIMWLLPTSESPKDYFDAKTYVAGPDDEYLRKIECFELVCHAPVEYFKQRYSPYPFLSKLEKVFRKNVIIY